MGVVPAAVGPSLVEEGKYVAAGADAVVGDVGVLGACLADCVVRLSGGVAGEAVAGGAEVGGGGS